MELRELPDVLRCRLRERDALDEFVAEFAVFVRLVFFGGVFEH